MNTKIKPTKTAQLAIKSIGPADKEILKALQSEQKPETILRKTQIRWLCYHVLAMNGYTFEEINNASDSE